MAGLDGRAVIVTGAGGGLGRECLSHVELGVNPLG
jgi:NAD(P)-dependent dehydrogenase (short-subunit alcohol dehydrogenase family)